jgi:hypothetical protein
MIGKTEEYRLDLKVAILLIVTATFLFGCTSSKTTLATPTNTATSAPAKTTEPACTSGVCVRDVYLQIVGGDTLLVQFDLTDENNEVNFGEELEFKSKITFALFSIETSGDDTYLAGMNPDISLYSCYAGNDIPWSNGQLAAVCSIAIPMNILQVRPNEGDPIKVEIVTPKFETDAIWLQTE